MNKYLKLTIFFTALWIFIFFAGIPLYNYFVFGALDVLTYFTYLPFTNIIVWDLIFYILYYGACLVMILVIPIGIIASRQTIKTKSKWASFALVLTAANVLFMFGSNYASWGL